MYNLWKGYEIVSTLHYLLSLISFINLFLGFSSKQVLQTHMEIHAKAESSAKAILQAVPNALHNNEKKSSPTVSQDNHNATSSITTLINIQQPASGLPSLTKQKVSTTKTRPKTTKSLFTNSRSSNLLSAGVKIMCCSCNRLFSTENELAVHKCIFPVVALTEAKTEANEIHIDPAALSSLISSPIVFTQSDKFQLPYDSNQNDSIKDTTLGENLEEDPQKLVLDMADQLSQVVQAEQVEKNKQKQLKKVEQLISSSQTQGNPKQNDQKKQTPAPSSGIQARARKTYSSFKSNSKAEASTSKETLNSLVNTGNSVLLKTEDSYEPGKSLIAQVSDDKPTELSMDIGEIVGSTGDQYIMLQQPDGQYVQICVPEGVDIEDALHGLNLSVSANLPTDTFTTNDLVSSNLTTVQDPLEQSIPEVTGTGSLLGEGVDDQQVIYLPVNEDGTCAIDATALAMLTGNGELPIIVTSTS